MAGSVSWSRSALAGLGLLGTVLGAGSANAAYVSVSDVVSTLSAIPATNEVLGYAGIHVNADSVFYEGRLKTTVDHADIAVASIGGKAKYQNYLYSGDAGQGFVREEKSGTATTPVDAATPEFKASQAQAGYVDLDLYKSPLAELLQFSNRTGEHTGNSGLLLAFLDAGNNVVANATNRILFAFNDSYTGDREFDDLVGVMTVTPLPGAVWLFGAGMAGLAVWRRRSGSTAAA